MSYARIDQGAVVEYPLGEQDIKRSFPNTSFTSPFIPPDNYVPVDRSNRPPCAWNENVVESTPKKNNGEWKATWLVEPASEEEIQQRTENEASVVRSKRNTDLLSCDWTQLPDSPVDPTPWEVYRQALRDITKQPGFPWNINWPVPPNAPAPPITEISS